MEGAETQGSGVLRKWVVRLVQLGLTVAVTWFIIDRVGLSLAALGDLEATAWVPEPLPFLLATALLLAAYFVSAAIWGRMVADLGGPSLSAREAVPIFMIANLGRYIPGKVWQIAGLAALAKGRGVPGATATGAAVLGHGIALVAATTLGLGALLSAPDPYRTWGVAGAVIVGVVLVLLAVPAVFARLAALWLRLTRTEGARDGVDSLHGARWLMLYMLNWVMYALSFWVLVSSLGLQAGVVPVASGFAAAYVLGYLMVFAPAGLGPREGFLILFLTPHLGVASSGLVAVVARLWMTLVEVVPAGIFWIRHVSHAPETSGDGHE